MRVPRRDPLLGERLRLLGAGGTEVSRSQRRRGHRLGGGAFSAIGFVVGDLSFGAERDAHVVEPVEQAPADLVVDLERNLATFETNLLGAQVDLPVPACASARQSSSESTTGSSPIFVQLE